MTDPPGTPGTTRTVIGERTRFNGTLRGEGAVLVCGSLRGGIEISGPLTIALDATVEADVEARSAHVSGRACGTMRAAQRVLVDSTGVLEGEIATPVIDLKPGSIVRAHATIAGLQDTQAQRRSR